MSLLKYVPEDGLVVPHERAVARWAEGRLFGHIVYNVTGKETWFDKWRSRRSNYVVEVILTDGQNDLMLYWWEDGKVILDWPFTIQGIEDAFIYEINECENRRFFEEIKQLEKWRDRLIPALSDNLYK